MSAVCHHLSPDRLTGIIKLFVFVSLIDAAPGNLRLYFIKESTFTVTLKYYSLCCFFLCFHFFVFCVCYDQSDML